ncbi:hypothetical protein C7S15_8976 (plasmid) [Burkholderia cepacia]|nr:hypothetical protein [Burkholderia cepacia]
MSSPSLSHGMAIAGIAFMKAPQWIAKSKNRDRFLIEQ